MYEKREENFKTLYALTQYCPPPLHVLNLDPGAMDFTIFLKNSIKKSFANWLARMRHLKCTPCIYYPMPSFHFTKKIAIRILFISSYLGWIPSISSTNWLAPKMVAYREKKTSKPETMENVYNLYITRKQQVVYNESLKFKRNRFNFDVKLICLEKKVDWKLKIS